MDKAQPVDGSEEGFSFDQLDAVVDLHDFDSLVLKVRLPEFRVVLDDIAVLKLPLCPQDALIGPVFVEKQTDVSD